MSSFGDPLSSGGSLTLLFSETTSSRLSALCLSMKGGREGGREGREEGRTEGRRERRREGGSEGGVGVREGGREGWE